jgi:pilus assembly protein FimV
VRNLTKALTVVSLLAPVSGYSLGIGDIRVRSSLNQNLNAEISLVAARGENPSNIKVSLAPAEKFDEAGVPWSYFLSKIRFQPIIKPNGSMIIKVTSREALKEPYLNFLLEVSWPKGNLYREFTVLVDPPAEYQPPTYQEPAYQEPTYASDSNYDTPSSHPQEYAPRPRPARVANKSRPSSVGSFGGQIVTRRNDTLWNVAERARGAGVSVEQMMMALYDNNPHAFYQQNVNALSAGKTLKIPEKNTVQQLSRQEALAEFGKHNDAWTNNRSSVPVGETQVVKEGGVDSQLKLEAPADATVAANETVSPSSEQTSGTNNTAPAQSAPVTPDAPEQAKGTSPVDDAVQSKIAALEKQMAMMQELIALKDKQLAELQNPAKATAPATQVPPTEIASPPNPPVTNPVQPVSPTPNPVVPPQVKPIQPVIPPKPVAKPIVKKEVQPESVSTESSSFLPWILAALGTTLLSLFGWLWWRKQQNLKATDAESMFRNYSTMRNNDSTGLFSTSIRKVADAGSDESSFLNDFKASDFESFDSFNVDHGDIDPIAEADVYLAYGRYQQAEDLMVEAIKENPGRDECKLKLLEIFHANSNKDAFENYAKELVSEGKKEDKDFWNKVVELGKDICPDSDVFSSANAAVFPAEPDTLTENVLFDATEEYGKLLEPIEGAESLGAATFEVSDIEDGESLFDSPPEQPAETEDLVIPETEKVEIASQEPKAKAKAHVFEDEPEKQDDNESIDFDLGPYPGSAVIEEHEKALPIEANPVSRDVSKPQLDDLSDKIEFESYEFDFNMDKPEVSKPTKEEPVKRNDAWDASQTLEFSMDSLPDEDGFGKNTIDFSFDLEPPQTGFDISADEDQGFMVSDLTDMDEMETKLDLAKAYIDMGDAESAKDIISQVIEKGTVEQKKVAQMLLDDLNLG